MIAGMGVQWAKESMRLKLFFNNEIEAKIKNFYPDDASYDIDCKIDSQNILVKLNHWVYLIGSYHFYLENLIEKIYWIQNIRVGQVNPNYSRLQRSA
jgi:hypothetical protein